MNRNQLFVLLNIPDDGTFSIDSVEDIDNTKFVHISRPPSLTFCPECGCIMHSKGIKVRTVNHPIYQDNSKLILKVHQRRWKCTGCGLETNESYPFLQKFKHYSSITPLLILEAMKDLNRTAVSIANHRCDPLGD